MKTNIKQDIKDSFFIYLVTVPEFTNISWGLIFKNFDGKDNILF
jgi:bifunctional N-acetylglucosamine-1-phosphate-uridyltransferase/glucosamine-1-phosphate-acetyltransferase GlmU-like protein